MGICHSSAPFSYSVHNQLLLCCWDRNNSLEDKLVLSHGIRGTFIHYGGGGMAEFVRVTVCGRDSHCQRGTESRGRNWGKHTLILCQSLLLPPSSISHTSALKYFPQPWEISPRARDSKFDTVRTSRIQTMTPHKRM